MTVLPQALEPLRPRRAWVMWKLEPGKGGRITKVPYCGHERKASSTDPTTWAPFDALPHGNGFAGPGIMLGGALQGVDLDACIDADGVLEDWAAEAVERLDTYSEVSPSGRGLKMFFYGPVGEAASLMFGEPVEIAPDVFKRRELSYFTERRFFTVTGRVWRDRPVRTIGAEDALWLRERIEQMRHAEHARVAPKNKGARGSVVTGSKREPVKDETAPKIPPPPTQRNDLHPDLLRLIRDGVPEGQRSEQFHHAVRWCADYGMSVDRIVALLEQYPSGIASKYDGRLQGEVERSLQGYVPKARRASPEATTAPAGEAQGATLTDFYAHMPDHNYLFVPTRTLWPASSVNGRLPWPIVDGKPLAPAGWLDRNRPIEQLVWSPAEDQVIKDRVMQSAGWVRHPGATVFNLYREPTLESGDPAQAKPWVDHVHMVYPDEADRIIKYLAFKVQNPGGKVNHALVLGGPQGIGKDTLLEPVKAAVGPWNWSDISPTQMVGRFNAWARAVILRVNEARDLGEVDRFSFYDHSKTFICAPPDVLLVDEKHLRESYCVNVCGVIITTNHLSDGLYLPSDDRRHYVAWSPRTKDDFDADHWTRMYQWFEKGGNGHVAAYLRTLDLDDFDPKAPPPKTPAFWAIVSAGEAPESGELRDVVDALENPHAVTLARIVDKAEHLRMTGLVEELTDRRNRRSLPHKLHRIGYVPVRNPDADDGLFKLAGRRQAVYAKASLTLTEQVRAARRLT